MSIEPVALEKLYHRCDPEQFAFKTTDELENLSEFIGQSRAVDAIHFGVDIRHDGYNVFALGDPATGKLSLIRELLRLRASKEDVPPDICYVYNFDEAHKPRHLVIPPGKGKSLARDMEQLVEEVRNALRAAFESEEYQNRQQSISQELQEQQEKAFGELQKKGEAYNLAPLRTPAGLVFAPVRDGEVMPPDEFKKLPDAERKKIEEKAEELQQEAMKIFQKIPQWERKMREKRRNLNREITGFTVGPVIDELRRKYEDIADVLSYLDAVEKDIIRNVRNFFQPDAGQQKEEASMPVPSSGTVGPDGRGENPALRRYKLNILVENSGSEGAPVVFEQNPSYQNLVGRVEHMAHMGALVTDFNMIRPGALHKASGGYLILDGLKLLQQPFAWEGLKQALKTRQIRIESLGQMYGFISTVSLEPQPLPLNVKVVLLGSPMLYYLIRHYDPEFGELFKVAADFDYRMDRTPENEQAYTRLIATMARKHRLRPFDRTGVARIIEQGSRMVEDGRKLSVLMRVICDLLKEADYWAGKNGSGTVGAAEVQKAVDTAIHRSDRLREMVHEQILRDIVLIDSTGDKVGQVNGLSVIQLGDFAFGRPSRITARIHLGKGDVVDIEREVAMGGPIHSKGVLILAGFLNGRFAVDHPLSLSASLVFEQSYSGVEGDSASSAELYALLSAIADVPIKQSLAVTGSVNQHGVIQPIGGVNEKIEGFFDVCRSRGLTGDQGVLIPSSNVDHLMLRRDVIDAAADGKFRIYAVETIDQGIEILTGISAGTADAEGNYPAESVNGKVHARLKEMAEKRIAFGRKMQGEKKEDA
ncbi:Lon protease family protein [Desulfococcus multivorans]|uniref:endopeptidase La n=1 Tax=Desulfococcus multivorans DSM 2059 TaxID=1121405 RepID=S7V4N5_DESML|nr:ATP-binding protein [Desulfococcus multivorans]AOY58581.1 peptidase S16, Lon protease [Desulfococcus multivorans]AQV00886.1 ATP-dependent protease [Desulfococcus multivorans]EPR41569.1 peptidase S16 lon domain protein [Desulfococcus multivorans DSM 2059]SJZ43797.1 lon-related putative ATP-dependent protease [Desulfococcus multivorans DSM 2059]